MGDSHEEELEPLFDYHRVQPVNFISLEDDSDSSPPFSPKRRKISKSNNGKKEDNNNKDEKSIVVVDCDHEEDWLPPPPKNLVPTFKFEEDSTIKELRLKKQELASLARSAEDALRAVDEAAKKARSFSPTSSNEDTEELPKPASNRAKIVISLQDKAGNKQYRVFKDESFEQLFRNYAEKAKIDIQSLAFCFDGDKIDPASTPQGLGMEDDDLIEVHVKKTR